MDKYLQTYAEPEITALPSVLDALADQQPWVNVVVIPACNESADFLRPPPPCGGRSLLILVINESELVSEQVLQKNHALATTVHERFEQLSHFAPKDKEFAMSLFRDPIAKRDVLLVDRFSKNRQLPVKGGVGHARKIGADLAAWLINNRRIQSRWIHCSDADVYLPETYFNCCHSIPNLDLAIAALVYPYQHSEDLDKAESKEVSQATQLYELSLRYYVAGMKYARSPYAFHTIGSTMAISAWHYAKVRGFPKRAAGEDFYLLNKLAKLGSVVELGADKHLASLEIESRKSDRVPFGTGAAVIKITDFKDPVKDFRFYDPAVFEMVKLWLQSLPEIWRSGLINQCGLPEPLVQGLKKIKTEQALNHAFKQSRDLDQFTRQMHTWFDAFRTLKLIHHMRDSHFSSIGYASLMADDSYRRLLLENTDLMNFHKKLSDGISSPQA